ncbi:MULTISPECIES: efflux RND transporter periplasmic adaptor subunit [unclassified Agarivorans]|uniref:efflux RND transporter periplasmic adaptor subunit n=1 Tax=unclassified Agarivorans TaxID=2636026 RepID=UPI003D7E8196
MFNHTPYQIVMAVFISTLISGCDFSAQAETKAIVKPRPVKLIDIDQSIPPKQRSFPGKVYASQQAELAFRISGELTQLNLIEGQKVQQGEVLSQLDKRDASNALLNAEANFELAQADFKRKKALLTRKLISPADVDSASASLKSADANLRSSRDQLAYTTIYAPFSGVVAKVHTDNYQMVQPNQAIVTLQNTDTFELKIQLPESMLLSLQNHAALEQIQAYAQFDNLLGGQAIPVHYKEHSSLASQGTQTYETTFTLKAPEQMRLIPGMSTSVAINMPAASAESNPIAILPLTALVRDSDTITQAAEGQPLSASVWVYQPDAQSLKLTPVLLGKIRADGIEILSGLNQGDRVVASGVNALTGKELIKPLHWVRGV